jgi:GAF domain-containing protein
MAIRPTLLPQKDRDPTSLTGELNMIAQRAQMFTGAHGSAIAAMDETTGQMLCCARSGSNAPDTGVPVKLEMTLTGLCIRNGAALRCDDTETDPRVDKFSVRGLNARSIVVVPVRDNAAVIGVLAVFSAAPCAFTVTHMAILRTIADQIARLILEHRPNKLQEPGLHPAGAPVPLCG